jgi:metacaspase-1
MFKSSRFTTVVTSDTRERLLRAQDNSPPIARAESHRGAVVAVQSALADLNGDYLLRVEVDGYFGARTGRAVEAFQRDYGLVADGVVGRQVLNQLDGIYSPDMTRPPRGISLHVGVDRVDPDHYGSAMELPSCENDAEEMRSLADGLGYDSVLLVNEDATTAGFTSFIRSAADTLSAGDALMLTFSGHGSQVPNTSGDSEADLRDETLCFYDRMLVDDEFYALLAELREGVRVHVILDSCHSGTAVKALIVEPDQNVELQRKEYVEDAAAALSKTLPYTGLVQPDSENVNEELVPIKAESLDKALDGERPDLVEPPAADPEGAETLASLFGDLYEDTSFGTMKFVEGDQTYENHRELYDAVKDAVGSKEEDPLGCIVTVLATCDDAQTTPAGNPLSVFTFNLTQVWSRAASPGPTASSTRR